MPMTEGREERTRGMHADPILSACREQSDCGRISPKMTMVMVEMRKPVSPDVMSAIRIESCTAAQCT
eukprot:2503026-Rhodomonas_salina.1